MRDEALPNRHIALCLRGFDLDPKKLSDRIGSNRLDFVRKGERRGNHGIARENYASIWRPMFAAEVWRFHLDCLVAEFGGWAGVRTLLDSLRPTERWLRIYAPFNGSPWVEDNGLNAAQIKAMGENGLSLQLFVAEYRRDELTHGHSPGPEEETAEID